MQSIDQIQWPGWNVVRLIGRGSFGAVYEIQRDVFGETEKAALKVITIPENGADIDDLRVEGYDDESITSRFQSYLEDIVKEYSTMVKMKGHPNVVYCDDVKYIQHDDGIGWDIYIKMELLTPIMKCLDQLENEQSVINLGIAMCNALVLCKERTIVHRDIKPQNIFVSQDGTFKLGDFGIAKTAERTTSGTKVGTYKYMAPEVYNNKPYGPAADQYSLGLVMYWLLNDRRTPFSPKKATATEEDLARKRRFDGEQIPPPAHGSKQLQAIVLKACAYDPKQRFTSAAEMLEELKALKNGSSTSAVTEPMVENAALTSGVATVAAVDELTAETAGTVGSRRSSSTAEENTIGAFGVIASATQQGQAQSEQADRQQNGTFSSVQPAQQTNSLHTAAEVAPPPKNVEEKKKRSVGAWIAIAAGLIVVFGGVLLLTLGKGTDDGNQRDAGSVINSNSSESTSTDKEPDATLPVQIDWAEWSDSLPNYVTSDKYEIEERTLYSSKRLETTSSTTNDKLDGWELYDTVSNGQWGQWSEWSETKFTESDSRRVEPKAFYHYHDKQTTTSTSASLSGWTLEGSTDEYGDYGSWSDWSKTAPSENSNRKIEVRYRYRIKETAQSNMPPMDDGWEVEWVEDYTESWSDWSDNYPSGPMMGKEVDERQVAVGTSYLMGHYCTGNVPGAQWQTASSNHTTNSVFNDNCIYHSLGWYDSLSSFSEGNGGYVGTTCSNSCWTWYIMDTETTYKTQYRWRWHYDIYHNYRWGEWSSWSNNAPANQSDRQIEMQYRYCDRVKTTVYTYYRWTDWSKWSETSEKETETHKGEQKTFYRYKDLVTDTVYYFQRWTDWSDYTAEPVYESETTEVRTKTEYRYKSKT